MDTDEFHPFAPGTHISGGEPAPDDDERRTDMMFLDGVGKVADGMLEQLAGERVGYVLIAFNGRRSGLSTNMPLDVVAAVLDMHAQRARS